MYCVPQQDAPGKRRYTEVNLKTLVIGLPKSGKTTYVQNMPGKWITYDLEYIAAAFRLREPHAERDSSA